MLPPEDRSDPGFRTILVGPENADPCAAHGDAIAARGLHYGLSLPRGLCYPYARGD